MAPKYTYKKYKHKWDTGYNTVAFHPDGTPNRTHKMALLDPTKRPLYTRIRERTQAMENFLWYTFTIKLSHRPRGFQVLHRETIELLNANFHRISKKYCGYPELTKQGMLHWHFLFHSKNFTKLAAFVDYWSRTYGNVDIRKVKPTLKDWFQTWLYARKNSRKMMNSLAIYAWRRIPMFFPTNESYRIIKREYDIRQLRYKRLVSSIDFNSVNSYMSKVLSEGPPHPIVLGKA